MMDLLVTKGPEVLNNLTIPKFGKLFTQLIKLDNLNFDQHNNLVRQWPEAIQELVALVQVSSDPAH